MPSGEGTALNAVAVSSLNENCGMTAAGVMPPEADKREAIAGAAAEPASAAVRMMAPQRIPAAHLKDTPHFAAADSKHFLAVRRRHRMGET